MSKTLTNPVSFIVALSLAALLYLIFIGLDTTKAANDALLKGYVWSSNIGWISFSCDNESPSVCGDSPNYQVKINFSDGEFSGYAWSSNIGWINFDAPGPYPGAPNFAAKIVNVDPAVCGSGKEVQGWVRVLSNGSGWDGWIKMAGSINPPAPALPTHHGICVTNNNESLSGWAWGDDVVGWVQFNFSGAGGMPSGANGGSGVGGGSGSSAGGSGTPGGGSGGGSVTPGVGSGGNDGTPQSSPPPSGGSVPEWENSIEKTINLIEVPPR